MIKGIWVRGTFWDNFKEGDSVYFFEVPEADFDLGENIKNLLSEFASDKKWSSSWATIKNDYGLDSIEELQLDAAMKMLDEIPAELFREHGFSPVHPVDKYIYGEGEDNLFDPNTLTLKGQ